MAILNAAFDDARTKLMGDAFDAVCGKLHGTSYPQTVRETVASRVIEIAAGSGERDPDRLADAVVASLGLRL